MNEDQSLAVQSNGLSEEQRETLKRLMKVDRVMYEPSRLLLVCLLYPTRQCDYTTLRHETGLNPGRLNTHLGRLEQAGYLRVLKTNQKRKPGTRYQLTSAGRAVLRRHYDFLLHLVEAIPIERETQQPDLLELPF